MSAASCDVLVVGGGPGGSSCARRLARAGADVVVLDRARFPRDKVCAGWITPQVLETLEIDPARYGQGRTLQPFTGFGTALLGQPPRSTHFGRVVSYGIRRCEFDAYLLERSGARTIPGQPLRTLRREPGGWIANDSIRARVVIGAGGHFCPVARFVNGVRADASVVVAQEAEFPLDAAQAAGCPVSADNPELFFWPDLRGYGWCVRKGDYLNIGAGRLDGAHLADAVRAFAATQAPRGLLPPAGAVQWKGHAYTLSTSSSRALIDDGVLLVGDAAGLALAPSGEGILAAIESGILAAEVVLEAGPATSRAAFAPYVERATRRFGLRRGQAASRSFGATSPPAWMAILAARTILRSRWLTRRVLLEDWFLHARRPVLAREAAGAS